MPLFAKVLDAVLQQHAPWHFDVLVIDSGSEDGTPRFAEAYENVKVIRIASKDFGHGRTRNQAISNTSAPYIAMITHDAQPSDRYWLANLVAPLEKNQRIAGVFGRHIAWPNSSPFTARSLDRRFSGFLEQPLVLNRDTDSERYQFDTKWMQFLHFFSDNNACLRRSVWELWPYPEVDFAEDQAWAKLIIQNGWSKAYAPNAIVYHSHDYGLWEQLQRAFDEARSFHKDFGYNLSPNLFRACRTMLGLTYRDLVFTFSSQNAFNFLRFLPKQILLNVMMSLGYYLGNRHSKLSPRLQQKLSRDRKLYLMNNGK